MTVRTLYLVRHGQYDLAEQISDGGHLTELGKMQAQYAGLALAHMPIDVIHTSTMNRAIETSDIIGQVLNHDFLTHDLLREAIPGIPPRIAAQILELIEKSPNFSHDTIHADKKRVDQAFETFFTAPDADADPSNEVLVCHGNILRYLVCKALDINVDTWAKININHCGITSISIDSQSRMRLLTHNETRHIPIGLLTD
jgi:serine/threonine-protein phosphatase PGAM5